ncbi:hypothetical protein ZEAMMB73_Zm00001d016903 [Zea mays]|uniref:Uncharacterized protein n=1 Tax=Zea mays TaxID=4577 RepID=A0A1D6HB32_MAIZE|nr:hypothetical protein ZEAMMB73_Zm00001d016903 [Zea mays]
MGSPGSANGRRGEYVRIPEEVEVASKGEGDAAAAIKAAVAAECPRVLRCRAIRWWAKVAVLGIFLAGAEAAVVVFLGPLVIKKDVVVQRAYLALFPTETHKEKCFANSLSFDIRQCLTVMKGISNSKFVELKFLLPIHCRWLEKASSAQETEMLLIVAPFCAAARVNPGF